MAKFSKFFASRQDQIEALSVLLEPLRPTEEIIRAAETKGGLEAEDAASLLAWGREPSRRIDIQAGAKRVRDLRADRAVEFVIPVYLTSFCQNDCLYCGYRKSNPLAERVRLSLEEYERELDLILSWGHRQIELVLADDPELRPDQLPPYVELTRKRLAALGGGLIALNAPAYEEADYRLLRDAGLDWVALWQETYHQSHFDRWHSPASPKRQYDFRLDAWDRAIAAGHDRVALGVLFGLYDWRYDVLALIEHGNYLRRTYGSEPYALGIPRLKAARGVLASQKPSRFSVSDEDYQLAVSVYHLAFPRARLFFNTRESYEFNWSMVAAGDLFTVDCETLPGAYLRGRLPGQFSTHAYPPRREVASAFESRGFALRYLASESMPRNSGVSEALHEQSRVKDTEIERWAGEQDEIRARLADLEKTLVQLAAVAASDRQVMATTLRERLKFFETVVVERCRFEESVLFPCLAEHVGDPVQLQYLRADHERFGVDLDRFERQVASYELSGDPTVLLSLGERMIRELRKHMDREDLLRDRLSSASRERSVRGVPGDGSE